MPRRLTLLTIGLVSLVLLGLLTFLTLHRLDKNRVLWQESLSRQGAFILASFEAASRAGMRMMRQRRPPGEERLQYLAEEVGRFGLVEEFFLLDENGRVVIDSDPAQVGTVREDAAELWSKAGPAFAGFTDRGFVVARLFRPAGVFGHHPPPWFRPELQEIGPRLGVVRLPLAEYQASRRAEVRQAIGLGAAIFIGGLGLIIALLFTHDRRLLTRLRLTTGHLVDQMPAGLLSTDEKGRLVTANLTARRLCRLGPGEEIRGGLEEVLGPEVRARLMALRPEESLTELETELTSGEEMIPVDLTAVRLRPTQEDPTAFILLLRDLRQVRELEERLKRSERLAALGRLSAGVAHEIRNPLSSIRGLAQYLRDRLPKDSEEAGYAEVMIGEADRLNRVVSDLLAYARPRPPQAGPADLNRLAERVVGLTAERAAAAGGAVALDLDSSLGPVLLDEDQMTQVILNLILNALEAGAKRIEVSTCPRNGEAVLRVADDGPGVAEESRERIFDPFFTTKAKGSGLGLSLSLRIVEEHGGRMALKDSQRGALFEVVLPLAPRETK